ncbi:MAG: YidB family protein [Gallionella sp.]|nr:YidB family protein [Gallionella sp.]
MSIFDSIANAIGNQTGAASGAQGNLLESVMGMMNDPKIGGLSGLVEKFSQGGLGEQVASWVSTGKNLPVSAEQIQSMLSSTGLQDIAAKFGFNSADATNQLSQLLPQVIDKLTPNGQVPAQGDVSQQLLAGLSGLFGNKTA